MVCLLAAPWVQLSVSAASGWPHNALRHHWPMPISCHFRGCKALLVTSLTHVSGAIASVQTFTFSFTFYCFQHVSVHLCVNKPKSSPGGTSFSVNHHMRLRVYFGRVCLLVFSAKCNTCGVAAAVIQAQSDAWYSDEGTGRPLPAQAPPRCTKCNSPPING